MRMLCLLPSYLMIDSSNNEMANASERELCARITADLEGC